MHILNPNLCQTTKFNSIIPNFDKVMPHYAISHHLENFYISQCIYHNHTNIFAI